MQQETNTAELLGALVGQLIVIAIPVVMIVVGQRRLRATQGEKGKVLKWAGIVLAVLVVLSVLARAGQVSSGA